MILDALGLLSDAQALTATALSTNTIDLGATTPQRQIGTGRGVGAVICIDVAADFGNTDETYKFDLVQSSAAALTTSTVLASEAYIASGVMISTLLTVKYIIVLPCPPGMPLQRYIGINYTLAGTTPTITVTAFFGALASMAVYPALYAKGYTIS